MPQALQRIRHPLGGCIFGALFVKGETPPKRIVVVAGPENADLKAPGLNALVDLARRTKMHTEPSSLWRFIKGIRNHERPHY